MSTAIDWESLRRAAFEARLNAYAPYSGFAVGAALLAEDGRIFTGANVENASYGLCQCAERSAIGAAITAGVRRFAALVIASPGTVPATPCGACRQVLAEFPPSFPVRSYADYGEPLISDVSSLLPGAFGPSVLAGVKGL
jgi:cytidine deaminase